MASWESVPPALDVTDQEVAAAVGERKREEKCSAFDLQPPIAGRQSFPKRFGGQGARRFCPPYARFFFFLGLFLSFVLCCGGALATISIARAKCGHASDATEEAFFGTFVIMVRLRLDRPRNYTS
jgi:hypothetical protein